MANERRMIPPEEGEVVLRGGFGVVGKVSGEETGGAYSVVEHPLEPGVLGGPPHTHEDEVSFVVEGEVGGMIGEEDLVAGPGAYVMKPRGMLHAFWNAGPERARILEITSPACFEAYFEDLAEVLSSTPPGEPPDFARISEVAARYNLTFHMERVSELMERHGVELR